MIISLYYGRKSIEGDIRHEDVIEREQTGEVVIVDDFRAPVRKEVCGLFLIHIQSHSPQMSRF